MPYPRITRFAVNMAVMDKTYTAFSFPNIFRTFGNLFQLNKITTGHERF